MLRHGDVVVVTASPYTRICRIIGSVAIYSSHNFIFVTDDGELHELVDGEYIFLENLSELEKVIYAHSFS